MHLNKLSFIRYFLLFYAALVTHLAFKDIKLTDTLLNKLALRTALQRIGMNGYEPNLPAYIGFLLLGIGAAVTLSCLCKNSRQKPENNNNKSRMKYHVTYQKWREWQPKDD